VALEATRLESESDLCLDPAQSQGAAGGGSDRTVLACADPGVLSPGIAALTSAGLELTRASGWGEALGLFRELAPVAVLVDSGFLEGDGVRLCATLRRSAGRVEPPILALCRRGREAQRALEAGATDILEKPLDWGVVARRLATLRLHFLTARELEQSRRQLTLAHRLLAEAQRAFEQERLTDPLTRLPNRPHLERILERALRPPGARVALLLLDLDHFTELNETLGRSGGDALLRQVAKRFSDRLRSRPSAQPASSALMTTARLSGDEFALVLTQTLDADTLSAIARGLLDTLRGGFGVGDTQVHLSASIGIAVASGGTALDHRALLQRAETAMAEAKRRGGGQHRFYSEALSWAAQAKLSLDRRLRQALEAEQFELHYQPVVEAASRHVRGVEALLRWNDPERGSIPPMEFIAVAEDTGLMNQIGAWVLEAACLQLRSWLDGGLPPIRVAVNVSRCQLETGDFAGEVKRVLERTGIDPRLLELELSERGALRSDPTILAQIRRLKALGVRLVVDDFGTGESSISHLREFHLDGLKIDRCFVKDVTEGGDGAAITSAMAAMARQLRLEVVAEGVETEAELERVREYGCEAVQGFLFSRPVDADELRRRVRVRDGYLELGQAAGSESPVGSVAPATEFRGGSHE
jgi:diguanylate cyclase (GGDEF)-like protein